MALTQGSAFDTVGEDVEELLREFSEGGGTIKVSALVHLLQGVEMEGAMSAEEAREFCRLAGVDTEARGGGDQEVDFRALVQDMVFHGRPTPA